METIRKTVESKYAPKQTNVIWVDTSGDKPIEKHFIKGKWREMSGGGGAGSSNPTEADATKVWQVTPVLKETKTEETVIVPEQTLVDKQELEYNDKFVPGAQCVAVVNGIEYRGEVVEFELKDNYVFEAEFGAFAYDHINESFIFYSVTDEVIAKLSVIEETPIYDYNWAPGVKIPIPTAEDEGKILVVTKIEGDNTSIIVPEQEVPAYEITPLTDVDMTKFVIGNTVKVTVTYEQGGGRGPLRDAESANSQTFISTGVIIGHNGKFDVSFSNVKSNGFSVWHEDNSLYTDAIDTFGPNSTIKLEYIESNYEYQLQENSGGGPSVGPKVVTILDYDPIQQNSILIDTMGNEFHEGTDYEITYKDSGFNFDKIDNIFVYNHKGNWICNMIVLVSGRYTHTKIIEESYLYEDASYPSNLSYWDHTNNHYVGYWESA